MFVVFYYLTIGEFINGTIRTKKIKGHNFFRFNCAYMLSITIIISAKGAEIFGDNLIIAVIGMTYFLITLLQAVDHLALL